MLFCKCFNFLLGLSFSSKIARFAKEFAIHLWSDILPSFYNKVVPDIFIFKFCFILYYPFKAFGFISVIPRITYIYIWNLYTHCLKLSECDSWGIIYSFIFQKFSKDNCDLCTVLESGKLRSIENSPCFQEASSLGKDTDI